MAREKGRGTSGAVRAAHLAMAVVLVVAALPARVRGQSTPWPYSFPCKYNDGASPDVLFLTLGAVSSPVFQAMYDPAADMLNPFSGLPQPHYMRDQLGMQYFSPINKTRFPRPTAGWTSWTWYKYTLNEDTIRAVADFLDTALVPYGMHSLEIDDGWEIPWDIWRPYDVTFHHGMDSIAHYIRDRGMLPGLWLVPQPVQNAEDFSSRDMFVRTADGKIRGVPIGHGIIDPTAPEAPWYFGQLMDTLKRWGYRYLKFDYQPKVEMLYDTLAPLCHTPTFSGKELYRTTMELIRAAVGDSVFLRGSYDPDSGWTGRGRGAPLTAIGYFDATRIVRDVEPTEGYFHEIYDGILRYYFLHNTAVYVDPDALCVGDTISADFAQLWASLIGLGGMPTTDFDPPYKLTPDRLEILRRVIPPVDVRAADLYQATHRKHIFDLKISDARRSYDVVGLMGTGDVSGSLTFTWDAMGWDPADTYHVYDFWRKQYLGLWTGIMSVTVPRMGCRVLSFVRAESHPQLLSTSRHISQGWLEIDSLAYDSVRWEYRGVSELVANDPYELRFAVPYAGGKYFHIDGASTDSLAVGFTQQGPFVTVRFTSPRSRAVPWRVTFAPGPNAVGEDLPSVPRRLSIDGVYPNPVTAPMAGVPITVRCYAESAGTVDVSVRDMLGRTVAPLFHGLLSNGAHECTVPQSVLTDGAYVVVLSSGGTSAMRPFVLAR